MLLNKERALAIIKKKKFGSYHARARSLYDGTPALDQLAYRGDTVELVFIAISDPREAIAKGFKMPFLGEPESNKQIKQYKRNEGKRRAVLFFSVTLLMEVLISMTCFAEEQIVFDLCKPRT